MKIVSNLVLTDNTHLLNKGRITIQKMSSFTGFESTRTSKSIDNKAAESKLVKQELSREVKVGRCILRLFVGTYKCLAVSMNRFSDNPFADVKICRHYLASLELRKTYGNISAKFLKEKIRN